MARAGGGVDGGGATNLPVNIGAYYLGGFGWKGRIDEVAIFNRALSAAEVRSLYERGCAGQCRITVGGIDAEWTAPEAVDGAIPAQGEGFWYLYRGRDVCGTGSYGVATGGSERTSAACN